MDVSKIAIHREAVTKQLTNDSLNLPAAQQAISRYCSSVEFYFKELELYRIDSNGAKLIEDEKNFMAHIVSRLETLKNERKSALIALAQGKKHRKSIEQY
tara:strand:+ start:2548 stop:2847 length:300 start_codon:yes stop_codon:yes gene_type:complete